MNDPMKALYKSNPIGAFSGNPRMDPTSLEEYDFDDETNRNLWLNDIQNDPDFIDETKDFLEKNWKKKITDSGINPSSLKIHIVGQSHIDMAWKWRYEQTRRKGIKTYRKAILHKNMFPGAFKFAASEPSLLDWIKTDDPDLFNQVKAAEKEGAIELVGGAWVEPDCMLPGGEAFVRQRLYGMRFYQEEFGKLPEVEWFLDSFGYNVGLPQILTKSGTKFFWTNKITWNLETTFPFVHFWWEGPDGSRLSTANFGQLKESLDRWDIFAVGRHLLKKDGKKRWSYEDDYSSLKDHVEPNEYFPHVGFFHGKGDGGHGPSHQDMVELNAYIKAGKDLNMDFQWSTVHEYFNNIVPYHDRIPIWANELFLENHQGCPSGQSEMKRHNRRCECFLQATESIATILSWINPQIPYPFELMEQAWKLTLLNHFHDVLPGSSVPEVYDDTVEMWKISDTWLNSILDESFSKIAGQPDDNLTIYNPLPWHRTGPVFIPITAVTNLNINLDAAGKPPYAKITLSKGSAKIDFICQPVAAEFCDRMNNRPAGWWTILPLEGWAVVKAKLELSDEIDEPSLTIEHQYQPYISNGITTVRFNVKTGAIIDIRNQRINHNENLVYGDRNNLIFGYKDESVEYPAWNIMKEYWKYSLLYDQQKGVVFRVQDVGPIFVTLAIDRELGSSPMTQSVRLFKDDPTIYCMWQADWKEKNVILKVELATRTDAEVSVSDQMYCALARSTNPQTPCDKARWEKIMHKYVDLSTPSNSWGIALLNEGKYAYDTAGSVVRLTLHRSPKYPSPAAEAWINEERLLRKNKDGSEPPSNGGIGPISCRYAWLPHIGGTMMDKHNHYHSNIKRAAEEFNSPVIVRSHVPNENAIIFPSLRIQTPANVLVTALKPQEWTKSNSIILRVAEVSGAPETKTNLVFPDALVKGLEKIQPVDLLERPITMPIQWNPSTRTLSFTIHNYEVISFELVKSDSKPVVI
jgi:alpha-mannosidase